MYSELLSASLSEVQKKTDTNIIRPLEAYNWTGKIIDYIDAYLLAS
jgi:hypothetical protein